MRFLTIETCRRWRRPAWSAVAAATLVSLGATAVAWGQAPVGKVAPSFVRADLSGKSISLSRYQGKVVLLNFWATWCGPCMAELPMFSQWQREFGGQGLQVVGVSMDDTAAPVRAAYSKYRMAYPVVMGDEHVGKTYGGVLGVPVTFVIDRKGIIVGRYQGPVDATRMEAELKRLLAAQP